MKIHEIKQKSIIGAKWTVILSVIALPLSYIITILLGRVSEDALGIYALLNVFVTFVTTFIILGGSNVIIKYLPELKQENKLLFLKSYFFIILVVTILAIVFIYVFPELLMFIIGQGISSNITFYLIIFIPVIVFYSIFDYVLNGLIEIKISTLIKQLFVLGNFIIILSLFLLYREFFVENSFFIILGLFLIFYILMGILSFYFGLKAIMKKKENLKSFDNDNSFLNFLIPNFYFPKGFWKFLIFVHISTILVFAYDKVDQLFLINNLSISELGLYYAALQTAMLIRYVPIVIGSILLPTFSNMIASKDESMIPKYYRYIVKYNTLMTVIAALFCIFYSKEILSIFGPSYVENYLIIVILGTFFLMSSIGTVSPSIIIAKGKVKSYFINSFIQITFQIVLMFFLFSKIGILGLAISKGAGVLIAQIGLIIITYKIFGNFKDTLPREYIISVLTGILAITLYLIMPTTFLIQSMSFLVCLLIFLYLSKYSKKDLMLIFYILKRQKDAK